METSREAEAAQTALSDAQPAPVSLNGEEQQISKQAADDTKNEATNDQLVAQIVKQVNFYFSDANLPTDVFLLKEVQKNPEGWVPVRLIASFKRMKALTKDQNFIVAALQTSTELELSGHRVRRKSPLPMLNDTEVLLRTVIAENLPDQPTIDSLTAHFSPAGKVNMVRICQPNSGPRSVAQTVQGADLAVSRQLHALVEYSSPAEAAAAVKQLTDSNNWRSGLKVRPLLRTSYQPKQKQYQQQQPKPKPRQQPMQHQSQDSSRLAEAQLRQSQAAAQSQAAEPAELNGHLSAAGEAAAAVAQLSVQSSSSQQHAGTASAEAQQGAAAEPNVATEPQATASQPQAAGMSHEPGGQVKQGAKGKQGKKSKRDYAAWAGATAETRALATAHHDGNPDLETPAVSFGRPRIPKQNTPAAPGSQPLGPDGSKGFAMGRGRAVPV